MSYPTQASPLADILEALTTSFETNVRPLGYVVHGPHAGEVCTIIRVRETDIEIEVGVATRDAVAQDAVALYTFITGDEPPAEGSHSTEPAMNDALQADAEKLQSLGADPGPTLEDLDAGHDPELGHLGES